MDRYKLEEFDPDNMPTIENLDGTEIDLEKEKELPKMPEKKIQPKPVQTDEPDHEEHLPDFSVDIDPDGAYRAAENGREIVKAIAIITAVISAIGFLVAAFNGRENSAFAAAFRIVASYFMAKGKNWARIVVIVAYAVSIYSDLVLLFADYSAVSFMQGVYVVIFIVHAVLEYFLCLNKEVKAYFGKG